MFARTLTALAGASLLLATPALAQDVASMSVDTADLDLSSADGRARFDRRVRMAASQMCNKGSGGLSMSIVYATCRADVIASADQQVQQLAARKSDGRVQLARAR